MSLRSVTVAWLLGSSGLVEAGSYRSDFAATPPVGAALYGSAAIEEGVLKLTRAANSQQGSLVIGDLDAGAMIRGFTARFKLRIGGGNGADGFSFNFAPNLPDGVFGQEGAGSGLVVSFDTYDNGGGEAPAIEVRFAGRTVAVAKEGIGPLLRSGEFQEVVLDVDGTGTLDLTVGGVVVFAGVPAAFAPLPGRFGLGAATGSLNDDHFVDDLDLTTQVAQADDAFVIEAEMFDFEGGLSVAEASTMPLTGREYEGLAAVHQIDYLANENRGDGNDYRIGENPNVPVGENLGGLLGKGRPGFEVEVNYTIGWVAAGEWYNYTRTIPAGSYRLLAAMANQATGPSDLRNRFELVFDGATTTQQAVWNLGEVSSPGTGAWGRNNLGPLRTAAGGDALLAFPGGSVTLRANPSSGDFDWFMLVPSDAVPPRGDLLVRGGTAGDYAGDNVGQLVPSGAQVISQNAGPTSAAVFQCQVQNDGAVPATFVVKAVESVDRGWGVAFTTGAVDITTEILGAAGFSTGELAPGAGRLITLELRPNRLVAPGTAQRVTLALFDPTSGFTTPLDSVRAVANVIPAVQPDLMVQRSIDVSPVGDNVYNATGAGQTRRLEVPVTTAAEYEVPLQNDGNTPHPFVVKGSAGDAAWGVQYLYRAPTVRFDGADDHVNVGAWTPGTQWTVEAWVQATAAPAGRRTIAGGFNSCRDWGITLQEGKFGVALRQPGGCSLTLSPPDAPELHRWYHVAGTCDGSTARLYVDGLEMASGPVDKDYVGSEGGVRIGSEACCGGNSFPGYIRDVRIWARALSIDELQIRMGVPLTGTEEGLAGAWPMDEGGGSTVRDVGPSARHGQLANGAFWTLVEQDVTPAVIAGGFGPLYVGPDRSAELRIRVTPGGGVPEAAVREVLLTAVSGETPAKLDAVKVITHALAPSAVPVAALYTTDADFEKGRLVGVENLSGANQLQLAAEPVTQPFIFVPNSNEGTVSKVDTLKGLELARYRVCPADLYGNPSRTTIDQFGNCWLGNRRIGTVVKIGLLENGQWIDRNQNGIPDTSRDLNGDGDITGAEILPWGADECVLWEVVVIPGKEGTFVPGMYTGGYANDDWNPGVRSLAVDAAGNVWAGAWGTQRFHYLDGSTATILRTVNVASVNHTAYGALIDAQGIVWSSSLDKNHVLRLDPRDDSFSTVPIGHQVYGLGLDQQNHLFVAGWQSAKLSRVNVLTATKDWTVEGIYESRGVAVTPDGDVWTANSGPGTVARWSRDGRLKVTLPVGSTPTGVAVDAAGKVWVVNNGDEFIHRIDPATDTIDLSKPIRGARHYGYSDMTGIVARNATTRFGFWSMVHDGRVSNTVWGKVTWHAGVPAGTTLVIKARSSNDREQWSPWEVAVLDQALVSTPPGRYLELYAEMRSPLGTATPVLQDVAVAATPPGQTDLAISASVLTPQPRAEHPLAFSVTVRNQGQAWASGVTATVPLPADVEFSSIQIPGGSYQWEGQTVTARYAGLAPQQSGTFTIEIVPTVPGTLTSGLAVGANEIELQPIDNQTWLTIPILPTVCTPPPAGLLAWWPGDAAGTDLLGTAPLLAFDGVGVDAGRVGQAFRFDGVDDFLEVPEASGLHAARETTVTGWFRTEALDRDWQTLFWKGEGSDCTGNCANREYAIYLSRAGYLHLVSTPVRYSTSSQLVLNSPNPIQAGRWYHLAAVISADRNRMELYLDGRRVAERSYDFSGIRSSVGPFRLGAAPPVSNPFRGWLDDFAVWGTGLSAEEIAALYEARSAGMCATGPVLIQPVELPAAVVGRSYSAQLTAALGQPPYRFQVAAGSGLPAGLQLGAEGRFVGVPTAAGEYALTLEVRDTNGRVGQRAYTLRVSPCLPLEEDLVGWWGGDGNPDDLAGEHHGTAGSAVLYASGVAGSGFLFLDHGESYVTVPAAPEFDLTEQLTLEAWIKPDFSVTGDKLDTVLSKRDGCGTFSYQLGVIKGHQGFVGNVYFGFSGMGNGGLPDALISRERVPDDGQFHHIAATFNATRPSGQVRLYLDGVQVGELATTNRPPKTGAGLVLGRHGGCGYYSSALIDEVALYRRELTPAELDAVRAARAVGRCVDQPADLLLRTAAPGDAYALNDVYQSVPEGAQSKSQSVAPGQKGVAWVQVQNDDAVPRAFVLRASESAETGWAVRYLVDEVEINSLLHSLDGYPTPTLAPGEVHALAIEMAPQAGTYGNTAKRAQVTVHTHRQSATVRDAVEAVAVVAPVQQPDLLARRDTDVMFVGEGIYNADGAQQVKVQEVDGGQTAAYVARVVNRGNTAVRHELRAPRSAGDWTVRYSGAMPALRFDGVDDYIRVADVPGLQPESLTLEGWFSFSSAAGIQVLLSKPLGAATWNSYVLWLENGWLKATVSDGVASPRLDFAWNPNVGQWYHLAYTFDGTAKQHALVIDGEVRVSGAANTAIRCDAHPFLIGMEMEGFELRYPFAGHAREIRLWDRARSAEEIQGTMREELSGLEENLLAYWPLNEGVGTVAYDVGLGGLNGTQVNQPTWGFMGEFDLTAEVTSAEGWGVMLAPGQRYDLRVEVRAGAALPPGATREVLVNAQTTPARQDAVRFVTSVSTPSTTPVGGTYTTTEDFDRGRMLGVEATTMRDRLQLSQQAVTLPFLWVPNSNEGTISKIDSQTGRELARYRVCPANVYGNPSRTTVDLLGNCWVANRRIGTAVKVGLFENQQYVDRNADGLVQTSRDVNENGLIDAAELLPWGEDECVLFEVVLLPGKEASFTPGTYTGGYANDDWNPGPRGVAVDAQGHVWLGNNGARNYHYVHGVTGQILKTIDVSAVNHTAYGAVIDRYGILWSSGQDKRHVLRLDPADGSFTTIPVPHYVYGMGLDANDHLFLSGWQDAKLSRINVRTAQVEWTKNGVYESRGVAVTSEGDVWTANSGPGTVTRWSNDGVIKKHIAVGNQPTGVAIDADGQPWVVNLGDGFVKRIDPSTDTVDLPKLLPNTQHYGYSDMTGIVARNATTRFGTWTLIHDAKVAGTPWGTVAWHASDPTGKGLTVRVQSSEDGERWSTPETAASGVALGSTSPGRYLKVEVAFQVLVTPEGEQYPELYDLTVQPGTPAQLRLAVTLGPEGEVIVTGPLVLDRYLIEATDALLPAQWAPALEVPVVGPNAWTLVVDPDQETRFFRLRLK